MGIGAENELFVDELVCSKKCASFFEGFAPTRGLLRNRQFARFTMLPNATDVPFLGQFGVAALHKLNENGADGVFRNRAMFNPPQNTGIPENDFKNTVLIIAKRNAAMQVNKKDTSSKATLSGINRTQNSHIHAAKPDIQDASLSQKTTLKDAFKSLANMLAGGSITTREKGLHKEIRTLANNTKPLEAKQTDLTEKLDKAKAGIEKAKSLFEKNIIGTVIKAIINNIDSIMKNAVCQSIAKSFLTTHTRVTPESILNKTPNAAQKTEWASMINDMGILREDSKKPAFRVTPENLAKIQTRLNTLEEQARTPKYRRRQRNQSLQTFGQSLQRAIGDQSCPES